MWIDIFSLFLNGTEINTVHPVNEHFEWSIDFSIKIQIEISRSNTCVGRIGIHNEIHCNYKHTAADTGQPYFSTASFLYNKNMQTLHARGCKHA